MLHPFLDPNEDEELDNALEILAMERLYKRTGREEFKLQSQSEGEGENGQLRKTTSKQNQSDQEDEAV